MKQCKECLIEIKSYNWEICEHCGESFCSDCIRTSVGEGHECGLGDGWITHLNIKFLNRGVQLRVIQSESFPDVFRFKQECDGNTEVGVPKSWAKLILSKEWKSEDFKEPVEIRKPTNQE